GVTAARRPQPSHAISPAGSLAVATDASAAVVFQTDGLHKATVAVARCLAMAMYAMWRSRVRTYRRRADASQRRLHQGPPPPRRQRGAGGEPATDQDPRKREKVTMRNQGGGKARYLVCGANVRTLMLATTLECLMDEAPRTQRTYAQR